MARARVIEGLSHETLFGHAAGRTLRVRSAEVFEFAPAVLDTGDVEGVHDMRVATRRLRAVLEAYGDCFSRKQFKATLRAVKKLAGALGARRDPDVAIEQVDAIAERLAVSTRPGVEFFLDELRAEQAAANAGLERALAAARDARLDAQLTALAEAAESADPAESPNSAGAAAPGGGAAHMRRLAFGDEARHAIDKRRAVLRKRIRRAIASGKPSALHDTRIAAKRLRYLYEIAAPCFPDEARAGIKLTRSLQDVLGQIHDCDVMSARVRGEAERLPTDDPRYVGLEALGSYLDAQRRVLHRHFVDLCTDIEL